MADSPTLTTKITALKISKEDIVEAQKFPLYLNKYIAREKIIWKDGDPYCPVHEYALKTDDEKNNWQACWYCDICRTEAYLIEKEKNQVLADEQKKRDFVRRQSDAKIPKMFLDASFDNFIVELPIQQEILTTVRSFVETQGKEPRNLLFTGKLGTGKTFCSCAIANAWLKKGWPVSCITAPALIRSVRDTWRRESLVSETTVIDRWVRQGLLVIDEVGMQMGTLNELVIITEIINMRYQEMLPTVVIGNLTLEEFAKTLGERALDRFRESGKAYAFTWENRRNASRIK